MASMASDDAMDTSHESASPPEPASMAAESASATEPVNPAEPIEPMDTDVDKSMPDFGQLSQTEDDVLFDHARRYLEDKTRPSIEPKKWANVRSKYRKCELVQQPNGTRKMVTTVGKREVVTDRQRQYDIVWELHCQQKHRRDMHELRKAIRKGYQWKYINDTMSDVFRSCTHPTCGGAKRPDSQRRDYRRRGAIHTDPESLRQDQYGRVPDAVEVFGTAEGQNAKLFKQIEREITLITHLEPASRAPFNPVTKLLGLLPEPTRRLTGRVISRIAKNVRIGWFIAIATPETQVSALATLGVPDINAKLLLERMGSRDQKSWQPSFACFQAFTSAHEVLTTSRFP